MGPREGVLLHKYLQIACMNLKASYSLSTPVDAKPKRLDMVEKQSRSVRQSSGGFTALRLRGSGYASLAETEFIMGRRCAGRTSDGNAGNGRECKLAGRTESGGPNGARRRTRTPAGHFAVLSVITTG